MGLLARGILGFGVWLALVLGPLAAASLVAPPAGGRDFRVELAAATGFVAFGLLSVELALVSRLRAAAEPFGTDVAMHVHKLMGIAAAGFVIVHPLLLYGRGVDVAAFLGGGGRVAATGAAAFWATLLLVASSLARRRLRLPYTAWRVAHVGLAIAIVAAGAAHVLAASGYAREPLVAGATLAWAAAFLLLLARYRLVRPLLLRRRPWEVVANRAEGGDVRTLVLRPVGHAGLAFEPGQFVWIATGRTPFALDDHPITISSSAALGADRAVELSIKALGDWSREVVPRLAPGDRAWLDGPFGAFSPDRVPAQGLVLVAGGVGVTPMLSILRTMRDRGDRRPVLLVHAAHDATREVFRAELAELARVLPLQVVRVHEVPLAGDDAEAGLVTARLLRRHWPADAAWRAFLVCGPGPMMDAVERALVELKVGADRVLTERFDRV